MLALHLVHQLRGESLNMIILLLGLIPLREAPPFNMKSPG